MKEIINTYICADGRVRAYIRDNGKPKVVSYPRILMEMKLGKPLEPDDDVHHLDESPLNNELNNLSVVKHGTHQHHHSRKYYDLIVACDECGELFVWTAKQQKTFYSNRSRKNTQVSTGGPFCSRKCSSRYGRYEQLSRDT